MSCNPCYNRNGKHQVTAYYMPDVVVIFVIMEMANTQETEFFRAWTVVILVIMEMANT